MNFTKLKKEKIELDYNIKKIDNILDCEENLERYIELIENDKFTAPSGLNTKILEKISNVKYESNKIDNAENKDEKIVKLSDINKNAIKTNEIECQEFKNTKNSNEEDKFIKRIKYKFTDILKIAACTVFALMIWEVTPANTTYAKKTADVVTEQNDKDVKSEFNLKRKVNDFFMSPIKIERREK